MELQYTASGNPQGPLFVFLHGGGVASWMWEEQVAYFKDYHCITIDLPGHGKSVMYQSFIIDHIGQETIAIIEKLRNNQEVILCGFSVGAQIALQIISETNIINYAIINSALVRPQKLLNIVVKLLLPLSFPLAKTKRYGKAQAKALLIPEKNFELYFRDSSVLSYQILRDMMQENMLFTLPKSLAHSQTKTLVTVGEKERKMMKQSASDIVYEMYHATGVMIPKLAHGLPYAKPDLFNELVGTWLKTGEVIEGVHIIER